MSQQIVSNFFESVKSSTNLQTQFKNGLDLGSIIKAASEQGYEFSKQELQTYLQNNSPAQELSMAELEAVAGGKADPDIKVTINKDGTIVITITPH
jgi:predicted ribosomally synthesized peptide with nif11-like leader